MRPARTDLDGPVFQPSRFGLLALFGVGVICMAVTLVVIELRGL